MPQTDPLADFLLCKLIGCISGLSIGWLPWFTGYTPAGVSLAETGTLLLIPLVRACFINNCHVWERPLILVSKLLVWL